MPSPPTLGRGGGRAAGEFFPSPVTQRITTQGGRRTHYSVDTSQAWLSKGLWPPPPGGRQGCVIYLSINKGPPPSPIRNISGRSIFPNFLEGAVHEIAFSPPTLLPCILKGGFEAAAARRYCTVRWYVQSWPLKCAHFCICRHFPYLSFYRQMIEHKNQ